MNIPDKLRQIADEIESADVMPQYYRPLAALLERTEDRKQNLEERQEQLSAIKRLKPCAHYELGFPYGDCVDPTMDTDKCLDPENCPNYLQRECKTCGSR